MNKYFLLIVLFVSGLHLSAQISDQKAFTNTKNSKYIFTTVKHLDATPVQNQNQTGTCWSFSGLSFLESELLRKGKEAYNLSEMWIARNAYLGKARNYLLMGGHSNFDEGGEFHDIPWVIKHYGIVPEYAYPGKVYGGKKHNHAELQAVLSGMVNALKNKPQNHKLTKSWKKAFTDVVDAYLGQVPDNTEDFTFKADGKTYTPKSFAKHLDLNMDDYVELTSFTHHPYYKAFTLEIPDNWQMHTTYNIPLDELMQIANDAIIKGFTFAWGADVSEKGFSHRKGLAILPADDRTVQDRKSKDLFFDDKGEKVPNAFYQPVKEQWFTPQQRQEAFENGETTDDHGMHIVGIVKDQKGTKYFVVKNSWGTKYNDLNGYFLASYPYFRAKTIDIFVHKDALPKNLKKKLGIN